MKSSSPNPNWHHYKSCVSLAGGVPVEVSATEANGFSLDPVDVERKITSRTKMLCITSPGNSHGLRTEQREPQSPGRYCHSAQSPRPSPMKSTRASTTDPNLSRQASTPCPECRNEPSSSTVSQRPMPMGRLEAWAGRSLSEQLTRAIPQGQAVHDRLRQHLHPARSRGRAYR